MWALFLFQALGQCGRSNWRTDDQIPLVERTLLRSSPLPDTLIQARLIPAEFFLECRDCIIFSSDTCTTLDRYFPGRLKWV